MTIGSLEICTKCGKRGIKTDKIGRQYCRECARKKRFRSNVLVQDGAITYIMFKNGRTAMVDTEKAHLILNTHWWCYSDPPYTSYVVGRKESGKNIPLHRLLMDAKEGEYVDHINGDGLDNRIANLRTCSMMQNQQNRKRCTRNTSGFKGVAYRRDNAKWRARICINGNRLNLGTFATSEEAAARYAAAARMFHGEFARIE